MLNIEELFEKYEDEFLKFDRVENKLHHRPDICAFLLLDKLVPSTRDMVNGADHDIIFIETDVETLAKLATEEDIITLRRCGVIYHDEFDCLAMFV